MNTFATIWALGFWASAGGNINIFGVGGWQYVGVFTGRACAADALQSGDVTDRDMA
jgi:hypothetical protein